MPLIDSALQLIESLFAYKVGSPEFRIVAGICVLTWVLVARIFMALFSCKRGIFAAFFTFVISMGIGLLAYGLAELYAVPLVDQHWADIMIPWAAFVLFVLLAVFVIGRRILNLSSGISIFIYMVATAAAIGAYFGAQVAISVVEFGEGQMEQRDQRTQDDLDRLM